MYEGELKGFVGVNWLFFEPKYNLKDDKSYRNLIYNFTI